VKRAFAVWITYVLAPHKGIQLKPRDIENLDEVKAMLSTRIEQWETDIRTESREEGRKEGREKGREEGKLEGEAFLLSRQLELKYGPLPQWVKDKIAVADKDSLENWGLKLINASSLDEVFE
jgi:predicted transposase YdaD